MRRMRRQQQFRAVARRRQRPTGGSEASRGRGSRGQGPAQRLQKLQQKCIASSVKKGTLL